MILVKKITLEEIKAELENKINDKSIEFCNAYSINDDEWICDAIHDFCARSVDIDTFKLCDWLKRHDGCVAKAIQKFGIPKTKYGEPNIMEMVRQGQCLCYEQTLCEDIYNIVKLLAVNYLIDLDNGLKIYEKIKDDLAKIDNCNKFSDILNLIQKWGN